MCFSTRIRLMNVFYGVSIGVIGIVAYCMA